MRVVAVHEDVLGATSRVWQTTCTVVRSGDEPGLHFLRHAMNPFRSPSEDFETALYVEEHPEVLELGVNPLVHYLMTPEGRSGTRYPPEA